MGPYSSLPCLAYGLNSFFGGLLLLVLLLLSWVVRGWPERSEFKLGHEFSVFLLFVFTKDFYRDVLAVDATLLLAKGFVFGLDEAGPSESWILKVEVVLITFKLQLKINDNNIFNQALFRPAHQPEACDKNRDGNPYQNWK
jgi:hypothetical protein